MLTHLKSILEEQCPERVNGVHHLSRSPDSEAQEKLYLAMREKEGRLCADQELEALPQTDRAHPHHAEWRIRGASLERLCGYLRKRGEPVALLDVGCGNGWMANRLANLPQCSVLGLDLNRPELEQGARVFAKNPRLRFAFGDLFEEILPPETFDAITLAGTIQYFADVPALLDRLFYFLKERGEIHIVDSPFYTEQSASGARERTRRHFQALDFPEMAAHYHPPLLSALSVFEAVKLYDPKTLLNRVLRRTVRRDLSPFPWIRLRRKAGPGRLDE